MGDEHRQAMQDYKAWQAEQRRLRQEKYQAERKEQEQAWKLQRMQKEVEKLDENPYVSQITLIEQTMKFCKGLLPQDAVEQKEEKKEVVYNNKDTEVVLSKKEDRADEWYFCPTKKKGAPKKGKASGDDSAKKPIKHNAETFKLFDTLGLEAPITVADVPPLLEKLEKSMETYQEKVQACEDHKEEMKRKIQEGEVTYDELVKDGKGEEEGAEEEKEQERGGGRRRKRRREGRGEGRRKEKEEEKEDENEEEKEE